MLIIYSIDRLPRRHIALQKHHDGQLQHLKILSNVSLIDSIDKYILIVEHLNPNVNNSHLIAIIHIKLLITVINRNRSINLSDRFNRNFRDSNLDLGPEITKGILLPRIEPAQHIGIKLQARLL